MLALIINSAEYAEMNSERQAKDSKNGRSFVEGLIPHRHPFLFIDELIAIDKDAKAIHVRYTFKQDEFFFQGHYPGQPIVPGVILTEAGAQAGALLVSACSTESENLEDVPILAKMNKVRFLKPVFPLDTIDSKIEHTRQIGKFSYLKSIITRGEDTVFKAEFVAGYMPKKLIGDLASKPR